MEGFGPKGSEKPLGLASEETEAHEGTAVTSASSALRARRQRVLRGLGAKGRRSEGATEEPQESGCDSKPHHADDLVIPGTHFYPPVPL